MSNTPAIFNGYNDRFVRRGGTRGRRCRFVRKRGDLPGGIEAVEIEIESGEGSIRMVVDSMEVDRDYYTRRLTKQIEREHAVHKFMTDNTEFVIPSASESTGFSNGAITCTLVKLRRHHPNAIKFKERRQFKQGDVAPGGHKVTKEKELNVYHYSRQAVS